MNNANLLCYPGHQSTGKRGITDFCKRFPNASSPNGKILVLKNGMGPHTTIPKHVTEFRKRGFNCSAAQSQKKDHSKAIVWFVGNDEQTVQIVGVLIGSSNQSEWTYYRKVADKGELDVFFFEEEGDGAASAFISTLREGEENGLGQSAYGLYRRAESDEPSLNALFPEFVNDIKEALGDLGDSGEESK